MLSVWSGPKFCCVGMGLSFSRLQPAKSAQADKGLKFFLYLSIFFAGYITDYNF